MIHERLEKSRTDMMAWCVTSAWFDHSTNYDFRVKNSFGYIWGLPLLVPTCPKKLFELGPRKNYVDIVTDTLHASSSDLNMDWDCVRRQSHPRNSQVMLGLNGHPRPSNLCIWIKVSRIRIVPRQVLVSQHLVINLLCHLVRRTRGAVKH